MNRTDSSLLRRELLAAFLFAFALTLALQWHNNAFGAEWSDSSDESAHYVTGLMVRDYIAQGLPESPMAYAKRYYEHYPYIGFGHFPPVFYVVQAAWTLPLGTSRTSLVILMAIITAALLTTTYIVARRYLPPWLCWGLMVLLATVPAMQLQSRMLIADSLVALLTFWSLIAFERYLISPSQPAALCFGILAATAILTKGTGLALAPIPLLAAVTKPRKIPLGKFSFWLPAGLVTMICAPWFLFIPDALHERVAKFGGIHFLPYRFSESFRYFAAQFGWIGLLLAAFGLGVVLSRLLRQSPDEGHKRTFWLLAIFLFLTTFAMRMMVGAWEVRHLLTLLPFVTLFIGVGLWWIAGMAFRGHGAGIALVLIAVGASCIVNIQRTTPKKHIGLAKIAEDLVTDPRFTDSRLLIVSDSVGEGVFVGEVAMRERRLGHIVERGSKILATDNFLGDQYALNYSNPAALMAFLEQQPSRIIVLDSPNNPPPHIEVIRKTIAAYASRWNQLASYKRLSKGQNDNSEIQVLMLSR